MDEPYPPNAPKKVVVDRYRKKIRNEEIDRGEANYAKSAAAGALAGLAARLKNAPASHRALIGAGAGLVAEGVTRAIGARSKDYYGEESIVAKKSEKLPIVAALGTAGVLAHRRVREALRKVPFARHFESGKQENRIEFGSQEARRFRRYFDLAEAAPHKKDYVHDILTGGIEGGVGVLVTDPLIHGAGSVTSRLRGALAGLRSPVANRVGSKFLKGALVGAAATGAIGAGVSAISAARQRQREQNVWLARRFKNFTAFRTRVTADEDLRDQRRKLATYAGGALLGAGALGLLLKRPAGGAAQSGAVAPANKPAGRGTIDRQITANGLRDERGYVHLRPMDKRQSNRFKKLPTVIQERAKRYAKLAVHPELSAGERQKFRNAVGKLRKIHNFRRVPGTEIFLQQAVVDRAREFSAFIKDVKFADLPAETRKNIRAFMPDVKRGTILSHYGMVPKELALKADPHNLKTARQQVGSRTPLACSREVHKRRETKHVLVNNDRIVDGHHFLAKAERGKVSGSLHVIDLTPARFQLNLESGNGSQKTRKVREFIYGQSGSDLPQWVQDRQANTKRRERNKKVAKVAGGALAAAGAAALMRKALRPKALGALQKVTLFYRQQLRDKSSDRWSDPRLVAIGEQPSYYVGPGNQRVGVSAIPVQHAQVLRKVYSDAGKIRRHGSRVAAVLRDAHEVVSGAPRRTDAYGRPQKREWEKPWFKKAAVDATIGAATVGGLLALKKNPALRSRVMGNARDIRRRVNKHVPDFFAGRKFNRSGTQESRKLTEFRTENLQPVRGAVRTGGKALRPDYRQQDYIFELARALRKHLHGGKRPPIKSKLLLSCSPERLVHFDDIAQMVGWDIRDPRGKSVRVFHPGARPRQRRPKEWYEKEENRRKIRTAIAAVGVPALGAAGFLIGRHFPTRPKPKPGSNIVPFPLHGTHFERLDPDRSLSEIADRFAKGKLKRRKPVVTLDPVNIIPFDESKSPGIVSALREIRRRLSAKS